MGRPAGPPTHGARPGRRQRSPARDERTGFSATTTISRAAFGVDIQLGFGAGNVVVADTIEIAIEIE
ncbi:MAG: Polyisoprenoid-binding protein YceI, partial [Streptosporangiaceae bacterium]|nr:Polyisoprenoid-binding protein YceI [Streptosporangiaceae bacterium]